MIAGGKFSGVKSVLGRLVSDECGAETVEWVLLVGLIAVVCLFAMTGFGNTLAARWNNVVNAL